MTPEEYERIKEAEKEHLRKLRKLKEAHRQLERQAKMTRAITDMTTSMQDKLDVHDDMMNRIATDSAISEARLEMAIESRQEKDEDTQALEDELELTRAKAQELVRKMRESPVSEADSAASRKSRTGAERTRESGPGTDESAAESSGKPKSDDRLPEKTIGRMKP